MKLYEVLQILNEAYSLRQIERTVNNIKDELEKGHYSSAAKTIGKFTPRPLPKVEVGNYSEKNIENLRNKLDNIKNTIDKKRDEIGQGAYSDATQSLNNLINAIDSPPSPSPAGGRRQAKPEYSDVATRSPKKSGEATHIR